MWKPRWFELREDCLIYYDVRPTVGLGVATYNHAALPSTHATFPGVPRTVPHSRRTMHGPKCATSLTWREPK